MPDSSMSQKSGGNWDRSIRRTKPVDVGEMLQVNIGATAEPVVRIVLVGGMKIYERAGAVPIEDLAHALHCGAIEGQVVNIQAVNAHMPHQPIEPST